MYTEDSQQQLLFLHLTSFCNGSLLGGNNHHHHHDHDHPDHDSAEHDHHHMTEDNNIHSHNDSSLTTAKKNKPMPPIFNFLSKLEQTSKKKNKRKESRKGKKFKNVGKRKEKKISRPFPFRIPRTSFSCKDRAPGYYADMEADCQVYRMCTARGGGQAFLCPEGTRFNQRTLVCDHQFRVSCSESSNFFHRNLIMHEESMAVTKKAKETRSKGKNESLRKRPRLQSSEIIKINPRPNVIRTGRLNGRLRFAPLFEKRRKENFEKFAKALDMTSQSKSKKKSKQRINQLTRFTLPSRTRVGSRNNAQLKNVQKFARKQNNEISRKNESKTIKTKEIESSKELRNSSENKKTSNNDISSSISKTKLNDEVLRNRNRNEDKLLGLPELPPDVTRNSPIFTFKAGPNDFVFTGANDDKTSKENSKENEALEEVETIGGQLLPPVEAGKSVAKFHVDREGPHANNQLAVFLTPPPPVPKPTSSNNVPLQLVGHVMTSNELSAFPDSPIVNIKQSKSSAGKATNRLKSKQRKLDNRKRNRKGRISSKSSERTRQRSRHHDHEEESRSSKGSHSVGLPIQLRPSGRGMPAPLVWISPASLARSPMVSLRKLETPNHNELFKSGNVERALTMTFPGRSTGRFNPSCLECMSLKHNSDECPPCFLSVR